MPPRKKVTPKYTAFRPRIRSRHPSHDALRGTLPLFPFRSVVRFGSSTEYSDESQPGSAQRLCVNTVDAISRSADKLEMKAAFDAAEIPTPTWLYSDDSDDISSYLADWFEDDKTVVAKHRFGSRNMGNTLLKSWSDYERWCGTGSRRDVSKYLFEQYTTMMREYRFHVTCADGIFLSARKMLKDDTPDEQRWFRNASNSTWILDTNEQFDRPTNFDDIEQGCVDALCSVGLDVGAFDVRVTSSARREQRYNILEVNSAPSMNEATVEAYKPVLAKILRTKFEATL